MNNEAKILEMLTEMKSDMAEMKVKLGDLAEAHEETRSGVNSLLEWADECRNVIQFPLPEVK